MKLALLCFLLITSMVGCTTLQTRLDDWSSKNNSKREYQVKTAWIRQTSPVDNLGFRKINRMTPLLIGDLVVQGNGLDSLVAYEKTSGREKWRLPITNGAEPSGIFIRDRIFLGASDGHFYSIEASTGSVQWTFPTRAENLAAALLEDGKVYFLTGNNVLYAVDAATGQQLWLYSRQDTSQFSIRGGSQPAMSANKSALYVGFSDGSLLALNPASGTVIWELQLNRSKRFRDVDATPVLDGDQLYIAGYDDKLYAVSTAKGEVLWQVSGGSYSGVTMAGDKLFYSTSDGEVWALKKSNGERVWNYKLKDGIATQVRSYKGSIVFGESQGKLRFLDPATGAELGSFEPGRGILSAPQVDEQNGRVYFISGEANLYAIDAGWIRSPYF